MSTIPHLLEIIKSYLDKDSLINHKGKSNKSNAFYFPIEDIDNVNLEEVEKIFQLVVSITNKLKVEESFEFLSQVLHLIDEYGQTKITSLTIGFESEEFCNDEKSIINFITGSLKNKIIDYRESLIYSPSKRKFKKTATNSTELRNLLFLIASQIGIFESKKQNEDFADYMSSCSNTTKKQLDLTISNSAFNYVMFESEKRLLKIYPELKRIFYKKKFFTDNLVFNVGGDLVNEKQFQKTPKPPKYHKEYDEVIDKTLSPLLEQRK
jgi:hypothetical protein